MKNLLVAVLMFFQITALLAQSPQAIPYQAVARDNGGNLISNQIISVRFSIHNGAAAGPVVYSETHNVSTNALGLFTLNVGQGTPVSGTMAGVNWSSGSKFLQVEMDPAGGSSYVNMGTTQMMSVPYALHAGSAANFNETDPQVSSATSNKVPKWDGTTLVDGNITDNGTFVGIGTTNPSMPLHINSLNSNTYLKLTSTSTGSTGGDGLQIGVGNAGDALINLLEPRSMVFYTGGIEKMRILNNGNVGIGTTNPSQKLDVAGNAIVRGPVFSNFGDIANLYIGDTENRITNTYGTGLQIVPYPGSNSSITARSGTGNVGIKTDNPSTDLDVNGNIRIRGGSPGTGKVLTSDANGVGTWTPSASLAITETDPQVNSITTNQIPKWNGSTLLDGVITDNGNIGIGNASPVHKLQVAGNSALEGNVGINSQPEPGMPLSVKANGADWMMFKDQNGTPKWDISNNSGNNFIISETNVDARLTIQGGGNVGIGTMAPDDRLHVRQNNDGVLIGGGNITGSEIKWLGIGTSHFNAYNKGDNHLTFGEANSLSQTNTPGTELMKLSSSGNLGIGTVPTQKLDVNGQVRIRGGAPGVGKVLTSSADGTASWQAPAVTAETDPQVSSASSNRVPKWNGSTLTDGIITDNGTNVGIGQTSPSQKLDIAGGIKVGNTTTPNAGAIRFTGSDFQGYDGTAWRSFITPPPAPPTGNYWSLNNTSVYYSGGSVGIGTSSPTANLEVTGSSRAGSLGIGTTPAHPLHVAFPSGGFGSAGLDQQQVSGALNTSMDRNEFWQSFTAGQSGNLSKIEYRAQLLNGYLWTNGATNGNNGTYRLYAGNGTSGTLLATIPASAAVLNSIGNGWHYINIPNIPVVTGQQYTFSLSGVNDPNANCPHCGHATMYFGVNGSNVYSGGQFSSSGFSSSNDLMFKTWVAQQGTVPSLVATTSGNIGIRNNNPSAELDVSGTTRTTNFRMTNGASNGFILQSDGSGNGSWVDPNQFPDKNWINSGNSIYTNAGQVGLNGVSSPQEALHLSGSIRLDGTSSSASSTGIIFKNSPQVSIKMDGPYLKFRNQSNNPSFQLDPFGASEFFGNMSVTGKGTFGTPASGMADGQFRVFSPQNAPDDNAFYVSVNNTANTFVMKDDGRLIVNSNPTATSQLDPAAYAMWVKGNKQGIAVKVSDAVTNGNNNFMSFIDGNNAIRGRIEGFSLANGDFLPPPLSTPIPTVQEVADFSCYLVETFGWTFDTDPVSMVALVATVAAQTACMDGGITYGSGSGDYAEYLEKENPDERFTFGDVVGVRGGKISKNTIGAEQVMSVSLAPIVLGKVPPHDSLLYKFEKIGFMGQVPVKVKGKVQSGDYILASGNNDGYAIAVSPENLELSHLGSVIGRSWMSMDLEQPKFVNVVIGVNSNEMTQIAKKFDERIKNLESELSSMKDIQTSQSEIMKQLNVLKAEINMKNTSMKE